MRKSIPTREATALLPDFDYLSLDKIIVPASAEGFAAAAAAILAAGVVGFDTESRPTFVKGEQSEGPHVVQFATEAMAYIFHVSNLLSHAAIKALLADESLVKVGFDLSSDRKLLLKKFGVPVRGIVDLRVPFRKLGYRNTVGLRAAVAIVFGQQFYKSKKISLSNWGAMQLSADQFIYAANDAYGALRVYLALGKMSSTPS